MTGPRDTGSSDHGPEDMLPDEADLHRDYPRQEPPQALDLAVLRAARAATQPVAAGRRPRRMWGLAWVASMLVAVIALPVAWQLGREEPAPEPPPPAAPAAQSADGVASEPAARRLRQEGAPISEAPDLAPAANMRVMEEAERDDGAALADAVFPRRFAASEETPPAETWLEHLAAWREMDAEVFAAELAAFRAAYPATPVPGEWSPTPD